MNKLFANKIKSELESKGYDVKEWITREDGGDCVDASSDDIIKSALEIAEKNFLSTGTANYRVVRENLSSDEGYDVVYVFTNYLEILISHKK